MDIATRFEEVLDSKAVRYVMSVNAEKVSRSSFHKMDKEDAMQELTLRAYEAVLTNFNPKRATMEAFVSGVVKRQAYQVLRENNGRRGERSRYEMVNIDDHDVIDSREERVREYIEVAVSLDRMAETCTPREREVFDLYRRGYTLNMCAKVMELSESRSSQLLNSAIRRIWRREQRHGR
jgi:RNA polymerase sigma factor (sigma-70 family)